MKKVFIAVLILIVIGIGFYWGYQNSTSTKLVHNPDYQITYMHYTNPSLSRMVENLAKVHSGYFEVEEYAPVFDTTSNTWTTYTSEQIFAFDGKHEVLVNMEKQWNVTKLYLWDGNLGLEYSLNYQNQALLFFRDHINRTNLSLFLPFNTLKGITKGTAPVDLLTTYSELDSTGQKLEVFHFKANKPVALKEEIIKTYPNLNYAVKNIKSLGNGLTLEYDYDLFQNHDGFYLPYLITKQDFIGSDLKPKNRLIYKITKAEINPELWKNFDGFVINEKALGGRNLELHLSLPGETDYKKIIGFEIAKLGEIQDTNIKKEKRNELIQRWKKILHL